MLSCILEDNRRLRDIQLLTRRIILTQLNIKRHYHKSVSHMITNRYNMQPKYHKVCTVCIKTENILYSVLTVVL